ncbi:MAG: zf-HC2 domain-containing protein [Pseudomonadota bacterium]
MKTLDEELSAKHIRDFRVAYLENLLTPEEMSAVEKHVQICDECRTELESMKQWENMLRTNKDSMCPEPWDLFEYVRSGQDPGGTLGAHVDQCALCRSDAMAFAAEPQQKGVPSDLWEKIAGLSADRVEQARPAGRETYLGRLAASWSSFLRVAVPAVAAAAILFMVVFHHSADRSMLPVVGLSPVQWDMKAVGSGDMAPVPKAIVPKKERLAIVLLFQGFDKTPPPARIDSLYLALKPTEGLLGRYTAVSPLEVKKSMEENRVKGPDREDLCRMLHDKLRVDRVVLLTIDKHGTSFTIEAALTDPADLKTIRRRDVKSVSEAQLAAELKDAALSVLEIR